MTEITDHKLYPDFTKKFGSISELDTTGKTGLYALNWSVVHDCPPLVRYLLDKGVDPNKICFEDDAISTYPFQLACRLGHIDLMDIFMGHPRIDVADAHNFPLVEACGNGHVAVVKRLLTDPRVDARDIEAYDVGRLPKLITPEIQSLLEDWKGTKSHQVRRR